MITLLKKEFMAKKLSLLVYCVVVFGMLWMYIGLFPSIQAQAASLTKVLDSFGPAIKAFGVNSIGFDTLEKFLSVELFGITWPILVITFVVSRAGQTIAGEIEKKTMGTLLSLPISRANIFLSKYFAGLAALSLFVLVAGLAAIPIAAAYGIGYHVGNFASLTILCLLFGWALYSLSMLISTIFNEKGQVYLVMGGVLMLMYIANIIAGVSNQLQWLKYGSLFHYFNASDVLIFGHISLLSFGVFSGIVVASTILAMLWFTRKDIIV